VITEKYQPKLSEIVGNSKALAKLNECMDNGVAVIVHGPAGIGKTSGVYAIAKKLGMKVVETNASDERRAEELKDVLRRIRMRGFGKVVYLLDEIDGVKAGGSLAKIVDEAQHSLVFTANELWKVPKALRDKCETIKFYRPNLTEVLGRVQTIAEAEGVKASYNSVSGDVRASINAVMYGGDKRESVNIFDFVESVLRGKSFDVEKLSFRDRRNLSIWLADNLPNFFSGRDLYEAYEVLSLYDLTGRVEVLKLFKRGYRKKPSYPFYLRRLKVMKRE